MRTRLLLILVLLLVTAAAHAQETDPAWLEVAGVTLRLRSGPSTDDAIINQLAPRTAVELLQRGDEWSQVRRQDGLTGWAANDFLLPWDERNRPDARRRVGEQRLFRLYGGQQRYADLRLVSDHSYLYSVARHASDPLPEDNALQRLGAVFDEQIYQQSLELWGIEEPPAINGDERIVILLASGFEETFIGGWYSTRAGLPQEPGPGFIGLSQDWRDVSNLNRFPIAIEGQLLAHEFGHLLHEHVGGRNQVDWVGEGLATFTQTYVTSKQEQGFLGEARTRGRGPLGWSRIQLNNLAAAPTYATARIFMNYIYERLGAEALRDFAAHSQQGLAALDALLAERGAGMDVDDFFADHVIANYLLDTQRENGRYGYRLVDTEGYSRPTADRDVQRLPSAFRDVTPPYSAYYYELPLPSGDAADGQLLLDFRLSAPAPQDAWLQVVQVLPEGIDVRRFRASEHRGRPALASLADAPERIFIAVSPFTPTARQRTQPVTWSLALREQPPLPDERAQVTTTLRVRRAPAIADNILGNLQRCSIVQVLEHGAQWSQILNAEGLSGWSSNDYLFHLSAPAGGATSNACAALPRAAHDGDLAAVQRLLAGGAEVNGVDAWGRSALHEAAFWGHDDVIARLLRAGADVHARDSAGRSALDEALGSGDSDSIRLLRQAGGDLDLGPAANLPPLVAAAASGNDGLLRTLLADAHEVNGRDDNGLTALAAAAARGHDRVVQSLINAGADPRLRDAGGRSPFMLAAAGGNLVTLERIHRAGTDANHVDREGHNAITLAAASDKAMNVAWLLLSTDVDVHHALPDSGRNALHLAAADGYADVIAMLLTGDVDADVEDAEGYTALQLAEAGGHASAVTQLNMVEDEKRRRTSSHFDFAFYADFIAAAGSGDLGELERLMAAGAPIFATDREGFSALMYAARAGHRDVALRLLLAGLHPDIQGDRTRDESAIGFSITGGHDDISAMLLLAGASGRDGGSTTAIEWAASSGREAVIRLLLDTQTQGRFDIETRNFLDETPLHLAVKFGHPRSVEILLDSGADPNARSGEILNHETALDFARGNRQIIDLLLAAGAQG